MMEYLRVLQIEDSESDAALILRSLEKAGYGVESERVEGAGEMREALERQNWDVVIADYRLPRFDAAAALVLLHQTGHDIPFIVVSGAIGEELAVSLMKAGAHDYLMKGELTRLAPAVEREIREARARRERRKADEELRRAEERFRALVEASAQIVWTAGADGEVLEESPSWRQFTGQSEEERKGRGWLNAIYPQDREPIANAWRQAVETRAPFMAEYRLRHASGEWRWTQSSVVALGGSEAELRGWVAMNADITARKNAEASRAESERLTAYLAAIVASSDDAIEAIDLNGVVTAWNAGAERIFGYSVGEMIGQPITRLIAPDRLGEEDGILRSVRDGIPVDLFETVRLCKDGQAIEVSITASPIRDAAGVVVGASKIAHDVSESKRAKVTLLDAEEQMRKQRAALERQEKSLREKEALLREIHHRVKNNLQVVSSLLALQMRGASNPETAKSLRESQNRIHSLALLHETLYQSDNLAAVDFPEYIHCLADHLFRSYGLGERVRCRVDLDPLCLNMDAALPCGLIINEVISNSLKHGFPDGQRGEVRIVLRANPPGTISLLLADDGVGIDGHVDWTTTRSLGLRLVRTLAKQLSAHLEIDSRNGTEVRLTFTPGAEGTAC